MRAGLNGSRVPCDRRIPALVASGRWVLLAGVAWAVPLAALGAASAPDAAQAGEIVSLRGANRALRIEIDLASGGQPYLVLDLPGHMVILKSHGVVLREFPFHNAWARRFGLGAFVGKRKLPLDTVWAAGRVMPGRRLERMVILSDTLGSEDHSGTVAFIPPTPEEETPTPASFRIRYAGGFSLVVRPWGGEVRAQDGRPLGGHSLLARLVVWVRSRPWLRDRMRVDLTMPEAEAGSLYRAFSDGTSVLILGSCPGIGGPG